MKSFWVCLGAAFLASSFYLILTLAATPAGFPLDDGWIHQVFARNLAQRLEFSYNPGVLVAGSTSPLWTFLLTPGYFLPDFYLIWTYSLGLLFLALTAHESFLLATRLSGRTEAGWATALFVIFEWRLVWAAASGMETLLFAWATLFFVRLYLAISKDSLNWQAFLGLGMLGGLLVSIRPEGVFLLFLAGLDLVARSWRQSQKWPLLGALGAGGALTIAPYFLFNYWLSGQFLPNTFGAKANYYVGTSLFEYFREAFFQLLLTGPLFALLPGLLLGLVNCRRAGQDWRPLLWPVLLLFLYAWRLPVTYHHARYLMPLIPFLALYGVLGTLPILQWLRSQKLPIVARAVPLLIGAVTLFGWFNGAVAYRFDVKYINDEQVTVGKWLAQNTPQDALVATHDIGAITFFGRRRLVDTAGLVSPEFVPLVRDQTAILHKVRQLRVQYFALLPNWYAEINAELEKQGAKVFQPQESYLEQFGEKNMAVFKLQP